MIRHRHLVSLSLVAAFAGPVAAAPVGEHGAAATSFERVIHEHGWAATTLVDLGNAYAGAGQHGRAILAYERAQLLAPRDAAIATDLAQAREVAGVAAPENSRVEHWLSMVSADEWSWLAFAAAALTCVGLVGLAWRARRSVMRTLVIGGALATVIAGGAATYVAPSPDLAVVVTAATARIAPFATAEAVYTAPAGETVHTEQRRGDYVYVRDGDRDGWLPSTAVEPVVVGQPPVPSA